ncbi:MAG: transcriptional regulator [Pseudomonadota bacterium]
MKTYPKKRIEIVIETPLVGRVTDCLDHMAVTGYSTVALTAGRGQSGPWAAEGQVGTALQMTQIVCISDSGVSDEVIQRLFTIVNPQSGFIAISDVMVLRPERF